MVRAPGSEIDHPASDLKDPRADPLFGWTTLGLNSAGEIVIVVP